MVSQSVYYRNVMGNKYSIPEPPVVTGSDLCFLAGMKCDVSYVETKYTCGIVTYTENVDVNLCDAGYWW